MKYQCSFCNEISSFEFFDREDCFQQCSACNTVCFVYYDTWLLESYFSPDSAEYGAVLAIVPEYCEGFRSSKPTFRKALFPSDWNLRWHLYCNRHGDKIFAWKSRREKWAPVVATGCPDRGNRPRIQIARDGDSPYKHQDVNRVIEFAWGSLADSPESIVEHVRDDCLDTAHDLLRVSNHSENVKTFRNGLKNQTLPDEQLVSVSIRRAIKRRLQELTGLKGKELSRYIESILAAHLEDIDH